MTAESSLYVISSDEEDLFAPTAPQASHSEIQPVGGMHSFTSRENAVQNDHVSGDDLHPVSNVSQPTETMYSVQTQNIQNSSMHSGDVIDEEESDIVLRRRAPRTRSSAQLYLNQSQVSPRRSQEDVQNSLVVHQNLDNVVTRSSSDRTLLDVAGGLPYCVNREIVNSSAQDNITRATHRNRISNSLVEIAVRHPTPNSNELDDFFQERPSTPMPTSYLPLPLNHGSVNSNHNSSSTTWQAAGNNEDVAPTSSSHSPVTEETNRASLHENATGEGDDNWSASRPLPAIISPLLGGSTQDDFINRPGGVALHGKRKLSSLELLSPKRSAKELSQNDEDEGLCCPICFEPWTACGNHRLTSLKCGHLFGQKCIEKWIKECFPKCPQCNAKAKKSDIRLLFAKKLCAINNVDLEQARKACAKEQSARHACEQELGQVKMKYHMAAEECQRLKAKITELNELVSSKKNNQSNLQHKAKLTLSGDSSSFSTFESMSSIVMSTGGCRVMDFDPKTQQFAISQPSPHSSFMNGFGIKRLSAADFKSACSIVLHQKPIRDLKFSHLTANHLLSASLDGSLRITDLACNTKVHEYKVDKSVWSCCWDRNERHVIYAGLSNGSLMQFDLRNTSQALSSIENTMSKCPIVSLYHVPPTATESFQARGGLFTGTLEGASFWQDQGSHNGSGSTLIADFKPTLLPLEPGSCAGVQYCHETQHCLVTYRPGRCYRSTTHILCDLQCKKMGADVPQMTCNVIDTYHSGCHHTMLVRNSLHVLPKDNMSSSKNRTLLSCVCDEARQEVDIYDSNRSKIAQSLNSTGGPPLAVVPVHMDSCPPMLAVLSESRLNLFKLRVVCPN